MLLRHLHPVVHGQVPLSLSYFTIANAQTKRPQFGAEFELGPSWGSLGKPQGVCGFHSADHIQQRRAAHFCSLILISQSYHRRNARGAARALNRVVHGANVACWPDMPQSLRMSALLQNSKIPRQQNSRESGLVADLVRDTLLKRIGGPLNESKLTWSPRPIPKPHLLCRSVEIRR